MVLSGGEQRQGEHAGPPLQKTGRLTEELLVFLFQGEKPLLELFLALGEVQVLLVSLLRTLGLLSQGQGRLFQLSSDRRELLGRERLVR